MDLEQIIDGLSIGLMGGLVSGLSTTLGALPIILKNKRLTELLKNIEMDFIIGLMLSASAFSLIMPAFRDVKGNDFSIVILSLLAGAVFIKSVGSLLKKMSLKNIKSQKALLFIVAMMAHNFPEGLASGGAMSMTEQQHGLSLLISISIQNIPEGLTTGLSFLALGLSPIAAFAGVFATGAVEILGGAIGGALSATVIESLPYIMAFAGGAMMSVTMVELLEKMKTESFKIFYKPSFLSGAFLMLALSKI
jgi:ZIP family zinc transporter